MQWIWKLRILDWDKGWSYSFRVGRRAKSSPSQTSLLRNVPQGLEFGGLLWTR